MEGPKLEQDCGDPDDWPNNWREMRDIDTALRCSICCEFMDLPMILSKCSHSYCSLCIRRSICYKTQCPTCFMAATEGDMINNRSLGEVIQKFALIRKKLLEVISGANNKNELTRTDTSNKVTLKVSTQQNTNTSESLADSTQTQNKTGAKITSHFTKGQRPPEKGNLECTQKTIHSKHEKGELYGFRKGPKKRYIQSDDSDTANSDSDSDVIFVESPDSADEDFEPQTPRKEKKGPKTKGVSAVAANSFLNRSDASPKENGPSAFNVDARAENVDELAQVDSVPFRFKFGSGPDQNSTQSPLRLPSLDIRNSMKISTPSQKEVPSCSTSTGASGSAEKAGRTLVRVPCPVCGVEVPDKHINLHLDRCLTNKDRATESKPTTQRRKQMPKLVYNLLSDKELKKKCAEAGLNNQGDRQTLIKRHHEFTLLYNAQCDAAKPMTGAEIVREVEKTEKAKFKGVKTKITTVNKLVIQKGSTADQVESAQKEYAKQHKSQFDQLIEEARKRRMKKQAEKAQAEKEQQESTIVQETSSIVEPPALTVSDSKDNTGGNAGQGSTALSCSSGNANVSNSKPGEGAEIPSLDETVKLTLQSRCCNTGAMPSETQGETSKSNFVQGNPPNDFGNVSTPAPSSGREKPPEYSTSKALIQEAGDLEWDDDMETQLLEADDISDELLMQQQTDPPVINQAEIQTENPALAQMDQDSAAVENGVNSGDDTLPLEDSQLVESDDDMFESPSSPSLLVDFHQVCQQNMATERDNTEDIHQTLNAVEHVGSKQSTEDSRTVVSEYNTVRLENPNPSTAASFHGESSRICSKQELNSESKRKDFSDIPRTEKHRKGKQRTEKGRISQNASINVVANSVDDAGQVDGVADFNLGWSEVVDDQETHREGACSETLSEAASVASSVSCQPSSYIGSNVPSPCNEVEGTLDNEDPQPRRSGRARNKRRLSGEKVDRPSGKRSRRLAAQSDNQAEVATAESSTDAMNQELEEKGRSGKRRGHGKKKNS